MYPQVLFTIFGKPITLYVVVYVLGLVPALALGLFLVRRRGASLQLGLDGAIVALAGAWAGSRLLSALQYHFSAAEGMEQRFTQLLREGGQASLGALLGLLVSLLIFFHYSSRIQAALPAMDVVVPGVALYQGIARLGCYAAGCCHGTPGGDWTWTVTFTNTQSAGRRQFAAGGSTGLDGSHARPVSWIPSRFLFLGLRNIALLGRVCARRCETLSGAPLAEPVVVRGFRGGSSPPDFVSTAAGRQALTRAPGTHGTEYLASSLPTSPATPTGTYFHKYGNVCGWGGR